MKTFEEWYNSAIFTAELKSEKEMMEIAYNAGGREALSVAMQHAETIQNLKQKNTELEKEIKKLHERLVSRSNG